jgi:hypothetical protein
MALFTVEEQPEVFLSRTEISRAVARATAEGRLRKLGPRLYTPSVGDPPGEVIARNRWQVVGLLFPDGVVSHRTALEGGPAPDGTVFLTGSYTRLELLPGLTISIRKGPGPVEGDRPFLGTLRIASEARAFLEVLAPSRARRTVSRGLDRTEVEERLERKLQRGGEEALGRLRDRARRIAPALDAEKEFAVLDELIGTLLGSRQARLHAPSAMTRARGTPYDPDRMDLFQRLFETLRGRELPVRPDRLEPGDFRHVAFYDAYFSNYIEGTEFEVEEAAAIVFDGAIPEGRPQDAHDILGTYRLVSRLPVIGRGAGELKDGEAFLDRLRRYHAEMLERRPAAGPGSFKDRPDRAGATLFVAPDLVPGTLIRGFELLRGLEAPLARGIFVSVLIAEVHPFRDGNGRISRVMMNAELVSAGQRRILVPIGYREDYLLALRAFSRQRRVGPVIRMLDRAQQFTAELDFADWGRVRGQLKRCGAFDDPETARLRLPSEVGITNTSGSDT